MVGLVKRLGLTGAAVTSRAGGNEELVKDDRSSVTAKDGGNGEKVEGDKGSWNMQ